MNLRKKGFQIPENIVFDSDSLTDTYGKLYAEPFERGFGTTVGNALRRVLLSSIEGDAATAIRIPGVLHEFSTLSGVKEDIVDVVLNVKQLRFRLHSGDSTVASINVKGPADVTGKDITGSNVDVLNPELHIATLEKGSEFNMELTVEKGRGYVTAELNKKDDQTVDTIAVDAIFTPIKKVNFWIEGARVGRSTDYDKLVMEIWTDGSITPQKALTDAGSILKGHLAIFSNDGDSDGESSEEEKVPAAMIEDKPVAENNPVSTMMDDYNDEPFEFNENLLKSVEELELSVRSYNCLKNANIRTLAELVQKTEQEMLRTKNFGRKSLNEIKELIVLMGLHFNMRVDTEALEKMAAAKRAKNAS
ncbi:MAG: DNA-directed RNA polymerase subunit alpha [Nitrospirota bacterium]|nr:DNA-directed RNA polymerase subunit alpha [Nitrospirota bacterium]